MILLSHCLLHHNSHFAMHIYSPSLMKKPGGGRFLSMSVGVVLGFGVSNILIQLLNQITYLQDGGKETPQTGLEVVVNNSRVRVLCMVMTVPENHAEVAIAVKETWGKRCTKLIFMSGENDPKLPSVAITSNATEGRDKLWGKTKASFDYIHKHHLEDAEWFLKADDDSFVILENLVHMLGPYSSDESLFFGCRFKGKGLLKGYMSGGAGYILSKQALRDLVIVGIPNHDKCRSGDLGDEDVEMGRCLGNTAVGFVDTRDSLGRHRFLPLSPINHVIKGYYDKSFWYWRKLYYPQEEGPFCCSSRVVSFHYVNPDEMHLLNFLVYNVKLS